MPPQPVALVTGAGRGLGRALAEKLIASGYAVALHYRSSQEGAESLAREFPEQTLTFSARLEEEPEAHALIEAIRQRWGRLDVLIHNAGHYEPKPFLELSAEEWQTGLASTTTAGFFTARAALPLLRAAGTARIVFIGDSSCERPTARDLALSYHIGKTGVLMLARSLAQSVAQQGITVNCVSPGYLETSVGLPEKSTMPSGRFGTAGDVWEAIQFLLRPESQYINGAHLVISGGWNLR